MKRNEMRKRFFLKRKEKQEHQNQTEHYKTKLKYGQSTFINHNFDDPYGKF